MVLGALSDSPDQNCRGYLFCKPTAIMPNVNSLSPFCSLPPQAVGRLFYFMAPLSDPPEQSFGERPRYPPS